jgi:adenylosuccinate synthase
LARFDWARFRQATVLNGATEIALTFADYLDVGNRRATCYADLSPATHAMIERLERVSGVSVPLVSVSFQKNVLGGVIDIGQRT